MSASVDFYARMNKENDAKMVASIMKEVAANWTPEYPTEIEKFVAGIKIDGNTVKVEYNYSLMSNTFCELLPQIMMAIARSNIGEATIEAWFTSENCGYEAEFKGRIFKNGKFRMSFKEHE